MNATHGSFGIVLATAVAAAAVTAGCDRQPNPKAGGGKPPPNYNQMMEQGREAARDAAAKAAQAATRGAPTTPPSNADLKTLEAVTAEQMAADVKARGADLLGKLETAIKANKLDDAQTYVDAFDKIKDNVPPELKTRYESLKAQFQAARPKATTPQPQPAPAPAEPNK
jgi:hypothetical protein